MKYSGVFPALPTLCPEVLGDVSLVFLVVILIFMTIVDRHHCHCHLSMVVMITVDGRDEYGRKAELLLSSLSQHPVDVGCF